MEYLSYDIGDFRKSFPKLNQYQEDTLVPLFDRICSKWIKVLFQSNSIKELDPHNFKGSGKHICAVNNQIVELNFINYKFNDIGLYIVGISGSNGRLNYAIENVEFKSQKLEPITKLFNNFNAFIPYQNLEKCIQDCRPRIQQLQSYRIDHKYRGLDSEFINLYLK